eukprot:301886-Pelagomonas_calceolata.AAC.5
MYVKRTKCRPAAWPWPPAARWLWLGGCTTARCTSKENVNQSGFLNQQDVQQQGSHGLQLRTEVGRVAAQLHGMYSWICHFMNEASSNQQDVPHQGSHGLQLRTEVGQ